MVLVHVHTCARDYAVLCLLCMREIRCESYRILSNLSIYQDIQKISYQCLSRIKCACLTSTDAMFQVLRNKQKHILTSYSHSSWGEIAAGTA